MVQMDSTIRQTSDSPPDEAVAHDSTGRLIAVGDRIEVVETEYSRGTAIVGRQGIVEAVLAEEVDANVMDSRPRRIPSYSVQVVSAAAAPDGGGLPVEAATIRRGDEVRSGDRWEPVTGDPIRTGDVVAVPTTVDGEARTRTFRPGELVTVRRAAGEGLVELTEAGAELVDACEGEGGPERVEAGKVRYGMVLRVPGNRAAQVVEVAHVEPVAATPGEVLLVFTGGTIAQYDGDDMLELVPKAEWKAHKERIQREHRRTAIRTGLETLRGRLTDLPVPHTLNVGGYLPSAAAVEEWAAALGVEVETREYDYNGKRNRTDRVNAEIGDALSLSLTHTEQLPAAAADESAGSGS